MPQIISMKDGRVETLFDVRHFEELVDEYMGFDAVRYFRELLAEVEEVKEEAKDLRHDVESYILKTLIPSIRLVDEDDREKLAEDFRAKMEDLYGIDE